MNRVLAATLLVSSLSLPAAAFASQPVDDATAPTPLRVSTGVSAPVLLDNPSITLSEGVSSESLPSGAQVDLSFTVNEKGEPTHVRVIKSFDPFWDARVVEMVSRFHYKPGELGNQPVAVPVALTVKIAR